MLENHWLHLHSPIIGLNIAIVQNIYRVAVLLTPWYATAYS